MLNGSNVTVAAELEWAGRNVQFEEHELIRENPWGKTWRLSDTVRNYYLKAVPASLNSSVSIAKDVARVIPEYAPEVICGSVSSGWLLLADHHAYFSAKEMGHDDLAILDAYAAVQCKSAKQIADFTSTPFFSWTKTFEDAMQFVSVDAVNPANMSKLSYYLDDRTCTLLWDILSVCANEINAFVQPASNLPTTLNHGDLHSNNFGVNGEGQFKFHDWDNAVLGPAGLSLNSYCGAVADFLRFIRSGDNRGEQFCVAAINRYCNALVTGGYSDREALELGLPGSIFSGLFYNLTAYADFIPSGRADRDVCIPDLQRLVSDIINCCVVISCENPATAAKLAELISIENNADHFMDFARFCDPNGLLYELNQLSNSKTTARRIESALEIQSALIIGNYPETVPSIRMPWAQLSRDDFSKHRINSATILFQDHGCLVIEGAFPPALLKECKALYEANLAKGNGESLKVGEGRYMLPLQMTGKFNSSEIYGSTPLMAVLENLLGSKFVLGSMSLVVSNPGADVQHMHIDHPNLFPELGHGHYLPPHAVTVLVPLVDIDEEIGGTEVVKGSHLVSSSNVDEMGRQSRTLQVGDCLMFDYRLYHRGLANRTDKVRPVLSLVYQRPWFYDSANFHSQEPLQIPIEEQKKIPDWALSLFAQVGIQNV